MKLLNAPTAALNELVHVPLGNLLLEGELRLPEGSTSLVVFAHGSRHSQRNQFIADQLAEAGMGTLLIDLLTPEERERTTVTGVRRFDIELLARRLSGVVRWLDHFPGTRHFQVGVVGAGIGAAAAIVAAAEPGSRISAIVSRGGRPDLAGEPLHKVRAPTLLIVGGKDEVLVSLNEEAYSTMRWRRELRIIPGTTHLFKEPGKLQQVANLTRDWFCRQMESSWRKEEWR